MPCLANCLCFLIRILSGWPSSLNSPSNHQFLLPSSLLACLLHKAAAVHDGYLLSKTLGRSPVGGHLLNTVMQKVIHDNIR